MSIENENGNVAKPMLANRIFKLRAFGYYGISCFITLLETNVEHIEVIGNVFHDSE